MHSCSKLKFRFEHLGFGIWEHLFFRKVGRVGDDVECWLVDVLFNKELMSVYVPKSSVAGGKCRNEHSCAIKRYLWILGIGVCLCDCQSE